MVEKILKVFMDDFMIFCNNINECLENLVRVIKICEKTNLVLNWEKNIFMVEKGIIVGHKISYRGLIVDKANIKVIEKVATSYKC